MGPEHQFAVTVVWTGNQGSGTSGYRAYSRSHEISAGSKPVLLGSSATAFRGDASRYNPEELLIAALSACHMLSYLHLCAVNDVVVTAYADAAAGVMVLDKDGAGRFTEVTLKPRVTIAAGSDAAVAKHLHREASRLCFIANSVNFPVHHDPIVLREPA